MQSTYLMALAAVLTLPVSLPAQSEPAGNSQSAETQSLKSEVELLKKNLAALEQRLEAQEKKKEAPAVAQEPAPVMQTVQPMQPAQAAPVVDPATKAMEVKVRDLDRRIQKTEKNDALDRVKITGDFRFETHSIRASVPNYYDGTQFQNLLVRSMFAMNILGGPPTSIAQINNTVASHYGDYQYFTNNLTFSQLKTAMGSVPPALQQQLFGLLMPATAKKGYSDNTNILYTNRLRLNLEADVSENIHFSARLSMYKVFGDSTGVQVFNGQPSSVSMDGTTVGVPNSDILRVERAYFTWNNLASTPFFVSVGRRPSTDGPPEHLRNDEMRGGTPAAPLINYQFDGITFGYHLKEKTTFRLCYGVGYSSGYGNASNLQQPQDRLRDVHFAGLNVDLWSTEKSLLQVTAARAFNVTDGFNGEIVLKNNPVTGDPIGAPVIMRFTPSANLGNIDLFGVTYMKRVGQLDLFASANFDVTRPNGQTTPFGGLMSDPFGIPTVQNGQLFYAGARYSFKNNDRTKIGFEYNKGSKYWFNFAQAEDDIIAPKTNTRGDVLEAYVTHRITSRFIAKLDWIHYNNRWSGSGWQLGEPKDLSSTPMLGYATYKDASMLTLGLTARF